MRKRGMASNVRVYLMSVQYAEERRWMSAGKIVAQSSVGAIRACSQLNRNDARIIGIRAEAESPQ